MSGRTFSVAGFCGLCKRFFTGEALLPVVKLTNGIKVNPVRKVTISCPFCPGLVNLVVRETEAEATKAATEAKEKKQRKKARR